MRYSKQTKEQAILLYLAGHNCGETAQQVGCSAGSVQNWLIEANIRRRWPPAFTPALKKQIVEAYTKQSASINNIRDNLHCSFKRIKQALAESKIPVSPPGTQRRHSLCQSFFERIDSEEKAYWIGFILADGSIRYWAGSWRLTVELQSRDIDHLKKLQLALSSSHKLTDNRGCVMFSVCSEKLCKNLITLGVTPRKMYTAKPAIVPNHLRHHYFRGLVDGDGSISKNDNKLGYSLRLFGTKAILSDFSHWLGYHGRYIHKKKDQHGYDFQLVDQYGVINALEALYGNASIYLDRKYARYQDAITRWYSMPRYRSSNDPKTGRFIWLSEAKQLPLPFSSSSALI